MFVRIFVERLTACLHAFPKATRANVAMIFGLSLIPISLGAGVGLDLSRALIVRTRMAEALDAAGLAVGSAPSGMSQADLATLANNYFKANYTANASFGVPAAVSVSESTDGSGGANGVTLSTSVAVPTTLMNIVGIKTMNVGYTSQVVWGQTKLWVSLVLDNTGSMCQSDSNPNAGSPCPNPSSGSKIASLQSATQNLLTMLKGAASNPGDVMVSIVPFVKDVNAGTSNANASWIDWTDWNAANGSCSVSSKKSQSICQSVKGSWTSASCSKSRYTTQSQCQKNGDRWTSASCSFSGYSTQSSCQAASATWTPNNHNTWNGCVTDRGDESGPDAANYDITNTTPNTSIRASLFPAEQYSNCPQSVMGMTDDWSSLGTEITNMVAGGSTNQTIGLVWGWQAQTQGDPLDATAVPQYTTQYIIILSDGLNTQNRWGGDGSDEDSGTDGRMADVCTNAKAAGITIYAVFVDIGGTQGNSTVLQNCATDSSKYYDLKSASQIATAFNQIGTEITQLRVAK